MKAAVGHSEDVDSEDAVAEVLEQCAEKLGGCHPRAALLFSSVDKDFETILARIDEAHPGIELIGCTTDGELSQVIGFAEDSLALTLISTDRVDVRAGVGHGVYDDPDRAGSEAIESARSVLDGAPRLCLTTPRGLGGRGNRITTALLKALGPDVALAGGVAGDQWEFKETHQFFKREVYTDSAPVLMFSEPLIFSRGARSGWMPVGQLCRRNVIDGRVIQRIGDDTGVEYFRRYLGPDVKPNSECPLAVFPTEAEDFFLCSVVEYNEADGTLKLGQSLPEGCGVQLTQATPSNILMAAEQSMQQALEQFPGAQPQLGILFSCATRKYILGTRTNEEYEVIRRTVSDALPLVGFYAYGEIGPGRQDDGTAFHSETLVSVLLGEA